MPLLPDRYPQKDFFILDIQDVVMKSDTATMEHPLFSLETRPNKRHLTYEGGGQTLEITPSYDGLPTVHDKDLLIFCISCLMRAKNAGKPISKRVRFTAREFLVATNRPTNDLGYQRLESAIKRLRGTTFRTTIETGKKREVRLFGLIDEGGFVTKDDGTWRLDYVELVLSDFVMRAIEAAEVLSISPQYFQLRRPLERRLYELARKHCGRSPKFQIGLMTLRNKTGSKAEMKKFRHNLRTVIESDNIPEYQYELTSGSDLVTIRPKVLQRLSSSPVNIPPWALEEGRQYIHGTGLDFYQVEAEFRSLSEHSSRKANIGELFLSFCKTKRANR